MNTNVSFKEKSKLLAAVAVLALIVCAFAVVSFSDESMAVDADTKMPEAVEGVITLDNNVTLSESYTVPEGVNEIDLGGYTLTFTNDDYGLIIPEGMNVSIDNGTITSEFSTQGQGTVLVYGEATLGSALRIEALGDYDSAWNNGAVTIMGGTVTVNGATLYSNELCGIGLFNSDNDNTAESRHATLIFNSGSVECGLYAVSGNNLTSAGSVIDINGGSFKTTYQNEVCMYLPMECTVTIDDATIEGDGGIEIKMGSLTLNNTTITTTGDYNASYVPGGNGCTSNGSAIVVAAQKYGGSDGQYIGTADISVTIGNGCTINTNGGNSMDIFNCKAVDNTVQETAVNVESSLDSVRIVNDTAGIQESTVSVALDDVEALTYMGDAEVTVNGDVTLVACDGREIVNNGNLTIAESAAAKVTGEGAVVNNGLEVSDDGKTAYVASWDALKAATNDVNVESVYLQADITAEGNLYSNSKMTIYLTNGNDLDMGGYILNLQNLIIDVGSGCELSVMNSARVSFVTADTIKTTSGSVIDIVGATLYSDLSTTEITFPDVVDGTIMVIASGEWTVFNADFVQQNGSVVDVVYGIAMGSPVYDGQAVEIEDFRLRVTLFSAIGENGSPVNTFSATLNDALTRFNGDAPTDAGTYENSLRVAVTLSDSVTSDYSYANVNLVVRQATPQADFTVPDNGWEFGDDIPEFDEIALGIDKLPLEGTWTYEYFQNDVSMGTDASALVPGTYQVVGVFIPNGYPAGNYGTASVTNTIIITPATLDVGIDEVDDTEDLFWGTDPDRYMNYADYGVGVVYGTDGNIITISGGIYYIADVNDGASQTIFGDGQDAGYYALLNITNPNTFPITVDTGDRQFTVVGAGAGDNTLQLMIYLGTDLDAIADKTLSIAPAVQDSGFGSLQFDLQFDLYRMTAAGYDATSSEAQASISGQGITRSDIADKTMWIVYDARDNVGPLTATLEYEGTTIYSQTIPADINGSTDGTGYGSNMIWYFSFDSTNGSYIGLQSVNETYYEAYQAYALEYGDAAAGQYTLTIVNSDGETVAQEYVYIEGYVDSGFSHYADSALKDLQELYKAYGVEYPRTDIVDNTMWFAWYQEGYEGQTIKAYVSTVENDFTTVENLWINGDPMYDEDGLRGFAWSFDNNEQGAKYVEGLALPKAVYVLITATDSEGTVTTVATGTIDLKSESSSVDIDDGMDLSDILGKKPLDFMSITVNQDGTTISIRGDVYLIDSWEDYYAGVDTEGYYIALTVDPSVESEYFDWSQANVTLYNPYNPLLKDEGYTKTFEGTFDGQLLLYIGSDLDAITAEGAKDITLAIDIDGAEPFLTKTTYTLDISGLEQGVRTYTVTYVDPDYPHTEDGYNVTEYIAGNILTLPTVPDTSKEPLGWRVDDTGVIYNCGTRVDLSQLDTDGDYNITFYAQYGSSTGGSTGDEPRQLWDYQYRYVYDAETGSMTVYVVTDKLDGYKNVLTTISISYTDWDTGAGDNVTYYISEPIRFLTDGLGIVAEYTFQNVASEGVIHIDAFVGNTWVEQYDFDTSSSVSGEPLLDENMTFEIVEAPADAPVENNYPWLQVNYERLQTVDSVTFYVDDAEITNLVWVDSDGEPIEGAPLLEAGVAYLQLSIADGEITEGEHTFRIVATLGEQTQTIEATYTVTLQ